MFKTVSESCNLSCEYCYYSRKHGNRDSVSGMDPRILETFIEDYMRKTKGTAAFVWQGGEPLLAGLNFFEHAVYLEAKYAPNNTMISNSIQTNGTLINNQWAEFFKDYNFFVGVSVDGPAAIHDSRRVTANGMGSFKKAMKGIQILEEYGVEYNILTVLHRGNIDKADQLMNFYEENSFQWIQFLPAMKFHSQSTEDFGEYEITSEEYANFLCYVFDRWYDEALRHDNLNYSIRFIDSVLSTYLNEDPTYCVINQKCSDTIIVEQNGDVYPCDFYMSEKWKMGNISIDSIDQLLRSGSYERFRNLKSNLSEKCQNCKWKNKCYGGCPRNKKSEEHKPDVDYFCESYKKFYSYTETRMKRIADIIKGDETTSSV